MSTINAGRFISPQLPAAVSTNVDTESAITPDRNQENADREAWQDLIDHPLIEWGLDSSCFDDEDMEAPSKQVIQDAIHLASMLSDKGFHAPTRVVPDPHGGIVFERQEPHRFESIRLSSDRTIEYCLFRDSRLVDRYPFPLQVLGAK